ncbi:hypothetical protein SCLCIDRAFT_1152588, partial [Scleroderma citrinum Foug A]
MPFLRVLMTLPLKELTIQTLDDLGDRAWTLLNSMTGIRRLSAWSYKLLHMLQGWAAQLGPTLRHLQLGYCLHVPPITLISVFSQLPLLRSLRIWGVPSIAIPSIMACLPNLIVLEMDYQEQGNFPFPSTPLPHLQQLTIVQPTSSSLCDFGTDELWNWTSSLIPHEGSLQSFSLVSFEIVIPLSFIACLVHGHGWSLTEFCVDSAYITPKALTYPCRNCLALVLLKCSMESSDVQTITKAIEPAKNLHTLQFVLWRQVDLPAYDFFSGMMYDDYCSDLNEAGSGYFLLPGTMYGDDWSDLNEAVPFSAAEVKTLMLRPGSKLRTITFGGISYFVSRVFG